MNCTTRRPRAKVTYTPHFGNVINEFFNTAVGDVYNKTERKKSTTNPGVNVIEFDDRLELQLAIPGYDKDQVTITVDNDTLTISGSEKDKDDNKYRLREFDYSGFSKAFRLPEDINTDKIEAMFNQGVLTLTLLKKEEAIPQPPRTIAIS